MIKVGLDFDGVVAYNPTRTIRAFVKFFKKNVLGVRQLNFLLPRGWLAEKVWVLAHKTSIFPAIGVEELRKIARENKELEFHLVTARVPILEQDLMSWIKANRLESVFKTISINRKYEQPHEFKLRVLKEKKLDYFVEDNLDIVEYIRVRSDTKLFWIYNLIDSRHNYPDKFPHLKQALEKISK